MYVQASNLICDTLIICVTFTTKYLQVSQVNKEAEVVHTPGRYEDILTYAFSVEGITEKATAEEYTDWVAYGRGMRQQVERQTGQREVSTE